MTNDPFWADRFHWCALAAGFLAAAEGRLTDGCYVRRLAYEFFEGGAFGTRVQVPRAPHHFPPDDDSPDCSRLERPPAPPATRRDT